MISNIFGLVIVVGLWGMAVREYLGGRRSDWPFLALGTLAALAAILLAAWDLSADLGRPGDLAIAFAVLTVVGWSATVGWKYIKPGA